MKCLFNMTRKTRQEIGLVGSRVPAENKLENTGDSPLSAYYLLLLKTKSNTTGSETLSFASPRLSRVRGPALCCHTTPCMTLWGPLSQCAAHPPPSPHLHRQLSDGRARSASLRSGCLARGLAKSEGSFVLRMCERRGMRGRGWGLEDGRGGERRERKKGKGETKG